MATNPIRAIRVSDDLWRAARARAELEGTTVTAVVIAALRKYTGKKGGLTPTPARSASP